MFVLAFCDPAVGQTVYKCKSSDGVTTYSQQPCGNNSEKITLKPASAPGHTRADAERNRPVRSSRSNQSESACVAELTRELINNSDRRIHALTNDIESLWPAFYRAGNDAVGATSQAAVLELIRDKESSIDSENVSQALAMESAGEVCELRRGMREAEADAISPARQDHP